MDHLIAANFATLRADEIDLAMSALPHAPVVAERPTVRMRMAASLVRAASFLAPDVRTAAVARA